jgi:hypothetical protein
MTTVWPALCGLALAVAAAPAAPAAAEPSAPVPVELPFQPGHRSVERLVLLPSGLYGAVLGEDGRIAYLRVEPAADGDKAVKVEALPDGAVEPLEIADRESGFAWAPDPTTAYSLSPAGKLLRHTGRGAARRTEELGQVSGTRPFEDGQDTPAKGYQRSRAMFFDTAGNLYTAGKDGFLFRYDPATGKLERLEARLPAVRGREPWASLDAAVTSPDGLVYGGTFDGYLFTLNLQTMQVINLGKPLRQARIPGLLLHGGKVYGIGGDEEGLPRLFLYDPATRGFTLGGTVQLAPLPGFGARLLYAFTTPAVIADAQGRVYLATTGRLGKLYRWEPGL